MNSSRFRVLSSWSKGGVGTSLVLELQDDASSLNAKSLACQPSKKQSSKEGARLVFDMGATPCFDDAIPAKYVFLSHGHIDHIGAVFSHARAHALSFGGSASTYFVPAPLLPQFEQCRSAMSLLDAFNTRCNGSGGRKESLMKMNLVPVHAGDEFPLKGLHFGSKTSFFMRAFEVDHAGHPALGYLIGSRTASGLKKEYKNLDGQSLRNLVKSGVNIKEAPIEKIEVAYTGDTCARGLMKCLRTQNIFEEDGNHDKHSFLTDSSKRLPATFLKQLYEAELLLCELTYLDLSEEKCDRSLACERGHIHIGDLEDLFVSKDHGLRGNAKTITFFHLSKKYKPATRALDLIVEGIPKQILDRTQIAISSMLSADEKTSIDSIRDLVQQNGCISLGEYKSWKEGKKSKT